MSKEAEDLYTAGANEGVTTARETIKRDKEN
jgi:hypothetical protein